MAFCRNCGSELKEGTKFCPECGAPIAQETVNNTIPAGIQEANTGAGMSAEPEPETTPETAPETTPEITPEVTPQAIPEINNETAGAKGSVLSQIDRYGMFYGIGLLVLALIFCFLEPPFLKILLAPAAIGGAVFCLARKYRLMVFPILTLVAAVVCLFMGLIQASNRGLFTTARKYREQQKAELEKLEKEAEKYDDYDIDDLIADAIDDVEDAEDAVEEAVEEAADEVEDAAEEPESLIEGIVDDLKPSSGVDPELKAFLDSYEDFVDEYVEFMKDYKSDPSNVLSMIGEYSDIMLKLQDFTEKIEKYDTNNMSPADLAYFLEVTGRCTKKMMDVL